MDPEYKDSDITSNLELLISSSPEPINLPEIYDQLYNIDLSFGTQDIKQLEESLNNLNFMLTENKIIQKVKPIFEKFSIAEHLTFIVTNESTFSPQIIKLALNLIRLFIDSGDFYPHVENNFYQYAFEQAGILDLFIEKIRIDNIESIEIYLKVLNSMCYLNAPFTTRYLNECAFSISQFINDYYTFIDDYYKYNESLLSSKPVTKLFTLVTNMIYNLSFSINEANYHFFYTFIDYSFHRNPDTCFKNKFLLYIVFNIASKTMEGADLIYNNEIIISTMNDLLISGNFDLIKVTLKIVNAFLEHHLTLDGKFNLINFFILLQLSDTPNEEEKDKLIRLSLEIINFCMRDGNMVQQLFYHKNIMIYINEAYGHHSSETKKQLALVLSSIVHEANIDYLYRLVKDHLTFHLVDCLSIDDNNIIIPVLKSLSAIFQLPQLPRDEDNGNIIPISDFDRAEGIQIIKDLNYEEEEIDELAHQFLDLLENADDNSSESF